jgi:hypothetical protein
MLTKWQKAHQQLKERDMVRMHLDVPNELRKQLRIAAIQDGSKLRDVYIQALTDYLRERKIDRISDPKRSNKLKLDITGLEDL